MTYKCECNKSRNYYEHATSFQLLYDVYIRYLCHIEVLQTPKRRLVTRSN